MPNSQTLKPNPYAMKTEPKRMLVAPFSRIIYRTNITFDFIRFIDFTNSFIEFIFASLVQ